MNTKIWTKFVWFLNSPEFLENFREISLLGLNLEAFSFHFSFSISAFSFFILKMSEQDCYFNFHFSNFQYPLSQDTAPGLGLIGIHDFETWKFYAKCLKLCDKNVLWQTVHINIEEYLVFGRVCSTYIWDDMVAIALVWCTWY